MDTISLTNVGKVREANEDNLGSLKSPSGEVFVLCDGMGGHVGGQVASTIAVESVLEYFNSDVKPNIVIAIKEAIDYANRSIIEKWIESPELKGMGTTIVLIVIQKGEIFMGHVGDSRAYLFSDGKLNRITKDHSYVQGLVDNNIITDEEAEKHPRKSELTKALGITQIVEPTIINRPIQMKNGDMLLMCSDGLSGLVNDLTMEQAIAKPDPIENIGKDLIDMALNAGGHDNITLHLIKITNSQFTKTIFDSVQKPIIELQTTLINYKKDTKITLKNFYKNKYIIIIAIAVISLVGAGAVTWFALDYFKDEQVIEVNKSNMQKDTTNVSNTDTTNVSNTDTTNVSKTDKVGKKEK